jgi:hypothetical protein
MKILRAEMNFPAAIFDFIFVNFFYLIGGLPENKKMDKKHFLKETFCWSY